MYYNIYIYIYIYIYQSDIRKKNHYRFFLKSFKSPDYSSLFLAPLDRDGDFFIFTF